MMRPFVVIMAAIGSWTLLTNYVPSSHHVAFSFAGASFTYILIAVCVTSFFTYKATK